MLDSSGQTLGRYDKIHLVPFGEYIPWKDWLSFVEMISKDVSDFTPGTRHEVFSLGDHRVNAIICFEAVFPDLVSSFVRQGSQVIVNLTNDGWYGDSAAPYQHLAMARWRAIENRRYLLRAANSGISAVIEPSGSIQVRSELLSRQVCLGRFAFVEELSVYTRYGHAFIILCAIITLLAGVLSFGRRFQRSLTGENHD
jgi:apolipoprotein N-acyltransferase